MITEIIETKIKAPNLEIERTQKNIISHLKYYSFEDRVFDLANLFKESIDQSYTETIQATTYEGVVNRYEGKGVRQHHPIFNGVYKLAPIEDYMGYIPEVNQLEIYQKYQKLIENPFLKQKFELVILAPLNNFATENNITAIDPIAFAYFKEGEHCYEKNYLITLSQWV